MDIPPSQHGSPPSGDCPPLIEPASKPARWRWWVHFVLIAAYPLAIGAVGWNRDTAQQPALGHRPAALLVVCGVELGVFGIVFGLAWLASRASTSDLLLRWRGGFWTFPLGVGYSVALRFAIGLCVAVAAAVLLVLRVTTPAGLQEFFLANRPDVGAIVDVSALKANPFYFWLSVTVVSYVVGGFREELWRSAFLAGTRNLWPSRLGSAPGQIVSAGLAAVVFGFGHLAQGPVAVCLTGLLGFGLGLILVVHRSIWPAAIAHGTFDATSMALLPWVLERLPAS